MCFYTASEANVSVVVNSTCSSGLVQDPIIVTQLPVILTCCVRGCSNWTGHWYRDGTHWSISVGATLSVKVLNKEREKFICAPHSDNSFCHDHNEGSITLIKCEYVDIMYV